jgi:hypothetical protein
MVRDVKGIRTNKFYEKSRLVIQGFNDSEKKEILTQSPTIQRASQRILMALMPTLIGLGIKVALRDISQAYTQSHSELQRRIFAYLPKEIAHLYPPGTIMRINKPLYGIAESGLHWFATYSTHHKQNLKIINSTYDPCLFITKDMLFGLVGMQTDDTLIVAEQRFLDLEEKERGKAKFKAKPVEILKDGKDLIFNGCILTKQGPNVVVSQKNQGERLLLVDTKLLLDLQKVAYIQQRARGAYIASICQPEAAFANQKQHLPTRSSI